MRIERWLQLTGGVTMLCLSAACGSSSESGDGRNQGPGVANHGGGPTSGGAGNSNPVFSNPNAPINTGTGGKFVNQDEVTCGKSDLNVSRIMPSVMLVVDGSQSMEMMYGDPPPDAGVPDGGGTTMGGGMMGGGGGGTSRWTAVRQALVDPTNGVVPKLQSLVKFGLAVFGTMPTCPLPTGVIDPALNNEPMITAGLPTNPPGYTTPTGVALD